MFGDVGQAIPGRSGRARGPTAADTRSVDPSVRRLTPGPPGEIVDERADVVDGRVRAGALHRRDVEQADRAADVGHRLAAEPLGVFEGSDRLVDVAVLLKATPRTGDVQQRDAQRVGDDVMYLAGYSSTLVGRGVFSQSRLRLPC